MRLKNKVAIVTGGTSGIGLGIVERFVQEGAIVFFSGRRSDLGNSIAKNTGATFIAADVTCDADVINTIDTASKREGRVDILVNNAGSYTTGEGRLENLSLDAFDAMLDLHLRASLAHIKHVSGMMRTQKSGSIINISSIAGHRTGYSESIGYSVAKAGLIHLSRCAAMQLGEDGVRVNSISPGAIISGMLSSSLGQDLSSSKKTEEKMKQILPKFQAIPRAGQPSDIANIALFLASDESSFLTGEDILVDGGVIWGRRHSEAEAGFQSMQEIFKIN